MAANIMFQRLFEIHREIWTFNARRDPAIRELVARQQLRLIGDVSRIVSVLIIPVAIYMIAHLYLHASVPFLLADKPVELSATASGESVASEAFGHNVASEAFDKAGGRESVASRSIWSAMKPLIGRWLRDFGHRII